MHSNNSSNSYNNYSNNGRQNNRGQPNHNNNTSNNNNFSNQSNSNYYPSLQDQSNNQNQFMHNQNSNRRNQNNSNNNTNSYQPRQGNNQKYNNQPRYHQQQAQQNSAWAAQQQQFMWANDWETSQFHAFQQQNNMNMMDAMNFPGLGSFLPNGATIAPTSLQPVIIGSQVSEDILSQIPDSSDLERMLIEEQQKRNKVPEITDVNSFFMNAINPLRAQQQQEHSLQEEQTQLLIRSKQGIFLIDMAKDGGSMKTDPSNLISQWNTYSFFIQDGHYIVCADAHNIGVYSASSKKMLEQSRRNDIQELVISPQGQFLVCIEKQNNESDNLTFQVLDALTLQIHKEFEYNFFQKSRPNWVLFDNDERRMFVREKKELVIFDTQTFEIESRLNAENFTHQYLSPSSKQQRLLFLTPEYSKGYEMIPAQLRIYNLNDLSKPIFNYSLSKSQEILPVWSPNGEHLLFWCSTIKDDTGNTYYGQHIIYRYIEETQSLKQLTFYSGVIHDIKWQPNSEHFVVAGGGMPAHTVLFTKDGTPLFEFGRHHMNKISWNPFSKLLFLAGFGNLSGDIEIWNTDELKKIGTVKAHCTVNSAWSLDGSRILCSVLFPKLRVDNNFKVFSNTGNLVRCFDFADTELYEVKWRPYPLPVEMPFDVHTSKAQQTQAPSQVAASVEQPAAEKPKKGMLTKRGDLSSMLNEQKISNHGGKKLSPSESFVRSEDKEMENTKNQTTQKAKQETFVFSRNKNTFVDQPKPPTEEEERNSLQQKKQEKKAKALQQAAIHKQAHQQQQQQQQQQSQQNPNENPDQQRRRHSPRDQPQYPAVADASRKKQQREESPEMDAFFDDTDEVSEQDKLKVQNRKLD